MKYIISHRGNDNHDYPENNLDAIKYVLSKDYIDGVEIDVRMTKDNYLIVYHNPVILTWNKIYIISRTKYYKLLKINKICLLENILKNIKTNKKILIEVKEESNREKRLVNKLLPILDKYPNLNIEICSFNYNLLMEIMKKNSYYKLGILVSNFINRNCIKNNFDFTCPTYSLFDNISYTKPLYFWTINNIKKYKTIFNKKSFYDLGIITDNPYKFNVDLNNRHE